MADFYDVDFTDIEQTIDVICSETDQQIDVDLTDASQTMAATFSETSEQLDLRIAEEISVEGSVSIKVTDIAGGHRVTVTDVEGIKIFDVLDGAAGANGATIESIRKTGTEGLVDTYTITLTDGQKFPFTVTNGSNSEGQDGVSPTVSITNIEGGRRITITDIQGTKSFDILHGTNGNDGIDGKTPRFKIVGGALMCSYDDGNTWASLGKVQGEDGQPGTPGADGKTPYIQDGYWYIDGATTGVKAEGVDGEDGTDGVLTNEQIALLNKLSGWYDENHYAKMTGSFTATNSGGTFEIGSSVKSTFTWSFSKVPTSLTVGGKSVTPTQTGETSSQTFTASSQTSKSFSISGTYAGTYGNETVSKTWTYSFQNRRYWGVAEAPTTINSNFIKSISGKEFSTSRTKNFNLNDKTSNKYIWYAYPKRFGLASFTMGGFAGGFEEAIIVSVTNDSGFTEDYYVYRSTNPGVGYLDVVVK